MPRVSFTENLQRHVSVPDQQADGATVAEVLADVFADYPRARPYILDEHGCMRKHVVIFVDGKIIRDRVKLSDQVRSDSEVYVMQALSGG